MNVNLWAQPGHLFMEPVSGVHTTASQTLYHANIWGLFNTINYKDEKRENTVGEIGADNKERDKEKKIKMRWKIPEHQESYVKK